jgi:hypothetical protein
MARFCQGRRQPSADDPLRAAHLYDRRSGDAQVEAVELRIASNKGAPEPRRKDACRSLGSNQGWQGAAQAAQLPAGVARESASYGLGQVMGYHWKALG